jgi:HlyD family secretion protein
MTATVTITTAHRDDVLRLPLRALSFNPAPTDGAPTPRRDGAPVVWRLARDGTLERVEVQTGLRDEQWVEIAAGALAAGDQVAVALRRTPVKREPMRIPGQPRFR